MRSLIFIIEIMSTKCSDKNIPYEGAKDTMKPVAKTEDEEDECMICLDVFNKGRRRKIVCPGCQKGCCESCFRSHLLISSSSDPECAGCHHKLSLEFIAENTPKVFHNNEYRKKRSIDLLSKEKSLLPATQLLVIREKKRVEREKQIHELMDESNYLRSRLREIKTEIYNLRMETDEIDEKKERKRFIMGCPIPDCRGFLSQSWKCETCETHICSKCRAPKKGKNDDTHVCNEDDVATAKLLSKETKPCPSCAVPIFKVSGCDQMWCQHEDTLIWLWNGKKKMAKHVEIGDTLIGEDGTPRRVEKLTQGISQLYEIQQRFGVNYKVTGNHLLTLRKDTKFIDIPVTEYMKLSRNKRKRGYYRVAGKAIQWKEREVPIDPYILGLWLGDGTSRGDGFATNDVEILQAWVDWTNSNGMEVTHGRPFGYDIRNKGQGTRLPVGYNSMRGCTGCKKRPSLACASISELQELLSSSPNNSQLQQLLRWRNSLPKQSDCRKRREKSKFRTLLRKCGVLDNKHIPNEYLNNSCYNRYQLLAGIIDTDGNKNGGAYRISQCVGRKMLCNGIVDLCHSLGLVTSVMYHSPKNIRFPHGKEYKCQDQIKIRVMGSVQNIPVILKRKRISEPNKYPESTIKVINAGLGRFVGWEVSGPSHRYLLGDGTVTHNCIECKTPFSWKTGLPVTGIIHNPHFYQWQRENNGGVAPRRGDRYDCGGMPWIRTLRLIIRERMYRFPNWTECHRSVGHVRGHVMPAYPPQIGVYDHEDLRLKYLLKNIDEDEWLTQLRRRQKRIEKNQEVHNILDMYVVTLTDLFQRFTRNHFDIYYEALALRNYVNDQLHKISKRYNNVVPKICDDWGVHTSACIYTCP